MNCAQEDQKYKVDDFMMFSVKPSFLRLINLISSSLDSSWTFTQTKSWWWCVGDCLLKGVIFLQTECESLGIVGFAVAVWVLSS